MYAYKISIFTFHQISWTRFIILAQRPTVQWTYKSIFKKSEKGNILFYLYQAVFCIHLQ